MIFDPSHRRLYFSAQRAYGFGAVYEVRGPVPRRRRARRPAGAAGPGGRRLARRRAAAAPERVRLGALGTRGLALDLRLGDAVTSRRRCAPDELGRVPGKRGSTARPHTVTLARARRKGREEMQLHLRIGRAELLRLRGRRSTPARITVDGPRPRRPRARRDARREDRPLARSETRTASARPSGWRTASRSCAELGGERVGEPEREVDRAIGRREVDGLGGVVGLVRAGGDAALVEAGDAHGGQAAHAAGGPRAAARRAASSSASAASCAARAQLRMARAPRGLALGARAELEHHGARAVGALAPQLGAQRVRPGGAGAVEQQPGRDGRRGRARAPRGPPSPPRRPRPGRRRARTPTARCRARRPAPRSAPPSARAGSRRATSRRRPASRAGGGARDRRARSPASHGLASPSRAAAARQRSLSTSPRRGAS